MRSMWKGTISFGLITIPVKLYAATESKDIKFNHLHDPCHTPIQYRKWCPQCDVVVSPDEILRGYEYEPGRYVVVTDADLDAIPVASTRTVEIVDFVELAQIDPVYFEKSYYLEPGDGGAKAYQLLRQAMEQTGLIAVARVVIRSKESLAAIRVFENGVLAMETMHFPDEVRSPAGLTGVVVPDLRPQELEMAVNLINSLAKPFNPAKFQNEFRQALHERIEAKVAGEEVTAPPPGPAQGRVVDLMEALRASIRLAEQAPGVPAAAPVPTPVPGMAPGPSAVPGAVAVPSMAPGAPTTAHRHS
jgi:DNA end-binding protein Ku